MCYSTSTYILAYSKEASSSLDKNKNFIKKWNKELVAFFPIGTIKNWTLIHRSTKCVCSLDWVQIQMEIVFGTHLKDLHNIISFTK